MGLWSSLAAPAATAYRSAYSDVHNFWYQPLEASFPAFAEAPSSYSALKISAVWAAVALLSCAQSMLPAKVYRDRDDGGKDEANDHEVARLFRRKPNAWQSPFLFRQYANVCLLLRGNFYARKVFDGAGRLRELVPMHPDRVTTVQLTSGRKGYTYRPLQGPAVPLTQDNVYHVPSTMSLDGVVGVSCIEYGRRTLGMATAQDVAVEAFYRHGMVGRGVVTGPGLLAAPARQSLKQDLEELGGAINTGKTLLLEQGFTIQPLTISARDAQYIDSKYVTIEDICRMFGIQPHMIAHLLRATNNNIEQQSREFVTYSLMPRNVAWESAARADLFDEDDEHYLEFLADMLLRGDTLSRFNAYAIGIMNGFMSENEVRVKENLPPVPGLWEPRRSANQDRGGNPATPRPASAPPPPPPADDADDADASTSVAAGIVYRVAERMARREVAGLRKLAERGRLDRASVADFYGRHVEAIEEALCLDRDQARRYGADQCAMILARGPEVLDEWERDGAATLAALALVRSNGHVHA
jgi:HK97 family phage portal protein